MSAPAREHPGKLLPLGQKRKHLFSKFRADPKLWIERTLKLLTTEGKEIPFKFNNIQQEYYEELVKLYWKPYRTLKDGTVIYRFQGIREINLKARQFGLSTLICAILLHDSLFFKNTKSYIFCQEDTKSKEMLRDKVKFFWEHLPKSKLLPLPKTKVYNESTVRYTTGSQLQSLTPGSSEDTARGKGRSITLRNALLSEMAEWVDAETLWQGLGPALADPSTNVFIESSPYIKKSGPFFRELYDDGKKPESIWTSRFWAWWRYEKYQLPFESDDEKEAFQASITDQELVERELYGLSDEQLNWRRYMVSFLGGGDKGARKFRADFPANEKEGWEVNDDDLFFCDTDREVRQVLAKPQEPVEGRMYVIIVDVAKGKLNDKPEPPEKDRRKRRKSGPRKGDYSVIDVWDPVTRSQVFQWADNQFNIRKLHKKIYEVFGKYPGVVAIEVNGLGETVVALARLIKDPYFQKMLYWHSRSIDGWWTGDMRETFLVEYREQLELAARVYAGLGPDDPEPDVPAGMRLSYQASVDEMDHFVDDGTGHPEASPGRHDDRIITGMIANQVMKVAHKYIKRHEKYYPDRETYRKQAHEHFRDSAEEASEDLSGVS